MAAAVAVAVVAVLRVLLPVLLLQVVEVRAHLVHKLLLLVLLRQVAEGRAHPAHKLLPLVLLQVAVVLARVPPQPVRLHLLPLLLPQVVVESEVPLHLQGHQSFSAAMARSSPPTVQPTYERAPSTRSLPKGHPCPSA